MFQAPPLLVQGRLRAGVLTQFCVTMSGDEVFGGYTVVNWAPGAHHEKPRRSLLVPCTVSETSRVLLVPSVMSAMRMMLGAQPNGAPPNVCVTGVVILTW